LIAIGAPRALQLKISLIRLTELSSLSPGPIVLRGMSGLHFEWKSYDSLIRCDAEDAPMHTIRLAFLLNDVQDGNLPSSVGEGWTIRRYNQRLHFDYVIL
jgi:hypothetical protein